MNFLIAHDDTKLAKKVRSKPAEFLSALIRTGFFPAELPPAITTRHFSAFCKKEYPFLNAQKGALLKSSTQYETFSAPRQKSGRRNLAIVHPLGQLAVSLVITQHRADIVKLINKNGLSLYRTTEYIERQRAFRGLDFRRWNKERFKLQSEYPFVLSADVSRFFYTIYTHSIPWAAIGKEQAKDWYINDKRKLNAHWSNDFDKAIQCCQSRETFGIPVGPDTSRIVAEILMAGIESDPNFSKWLKHRSAFRIVDDFAVGFEREEDAWQALASLRMTLWKYNLQLNDEKTMVLPSRVSLRERWEVEHEALPLSDINVRRQAKDILRLLDLTLHFCTEAKTDSPALLTSRRLSRLKKVKSSFPLILDTLFRLAREYPRCISHVASFLINNRQHCATDPHRARVVKWVRATLAAHSMHGHDFEVAWCLVVCGVLKIEVQKADIRDQAVLPNSVVLVLLGLLREQKLLTVPLSTWPWRSQFKKVGISGQYWLPFYEAVRWKWTADRKLIAAVRSDPIMAKMLSQKVTFLEKRIFEAKTIDLTTRVFKAPTKSGSKKESTNKTQRTKIKGFGDLIVATDLGYT